MKWLLEKKFPYNKDIFICVAPNENLENMKWLDNNFRYNKNIFVEAAISENLEKND
jgi:hypothetical protein